MPSDPFHPWATWDHVKISSEEPSLPTLARVASPATLVTLYHVTNVFSSRHFTGNIVIYGLFTPTGYKVCASRTSICPVQHFRLGSSRSQHWGQGCGIQELIWEGTRETMVGEYRRWERREKGANGGHTVILLLCVLRAQFYWRSLGDGIEGAPEFFLWKGKGYLHTSSCQSLVKGCSTEMLTTWFFWPALLTGRVQPSRPASIWDSESYRWSPRHFQGAQFSPTGQ